MILKKCLLFAFFIVSILPWDGVYADRETCKFSDKVPAGKVCAWGTKIDCPKGCYCLGGGYEYIMKKGVENACSKRWTESGNSTSGGWHLCPAEFSLSDSGAKSSAECYAEVSGKKVYNKQSTCEPGNYLPKASNSCVICPDGFKCPGGTFNASKTSDQGKEACPEGKFSSADRASCTDNLIHCVPGTYLPANQESCASCPDGGANRYNYCPGGSWNKNAADQGISSCKDGLVPNFNKSACELDQNNITVNPGYFLPANQLTTKPCKDNVGNKQYCPGGIFEKSSKRQGVYDCSGTVNSAHSMCTVTLTMDQMKYGVKGGKTGNTNTNCWFITDISEYKDCVFGK